MKKGAVIYSPFSIDSHCFMPLILYEIIFYEFIPL